MSTKRRRMTKGQRKKEAQKRVEYKQLSLLKHEYEVETLIHYLSSDEGKRNILRNRAIRERDIAFFCHILDTANDEHHDERRLLVDSKTLNKFLAIEGQIRSQVAPLDLLRQGAPVFQHRIEGGDENIDTPISDVASTDNTSVTQDPLIPPQLGERLLLLILTKDERVNIPGDLEEEFKQIGEKHGERYAKLWYYKQVTASAWPMIRKAVRWGLLASVGEWIRRMI